MTRPKAYSISEIATYTKDILEDDILLCGLFIEGEVSQITFHSSGHIFFTLIDSKCSISCIMFKSEAAQLNIKPKVGTKLVTYGRLSLNIKSCNISFISEMLEPLGKGQHLQNLQELKLKLQHDGIFENARPLPGFVQKIGLITSPTGAAVKDIIKVAKRRNANIQLLIFPAIVQGELAPISIAKAIELANKQNQTKPIDLLICTRGGGSTEDLSAFNTETVARAVFLSDIPIVSAVGHEVDYTLCDYAADYRASTPSSAAEVSVPLLSDILMRYNNNINNLQKAMQLKIQQKSSRLNMLYNQISPEKEVTKIKLQSANLNSKIYRINNAIQTNLTKANTELTKNIDILEKISPLAVLKRGFVLVSNKNNHVIKNSKNLTSGEKVLLKFHDGIKEASIL